MYVKQVLSTLNAVGENLNESYISCYKEAHPPNQCIYVDWITRRHFLGQTFVPPNCVMPV